MTLREYASSLKPNVLVDVRHQCAGYADGYYGPVSKIPDWFLGLQVADAKLVPVGNEEEGLDLAIYVLLA